MNNQVTQLSEPTMVRAAVHAYLYGTLREYYDVDDGSVESGPGPLSVSRVLRCGPLEVVLDENNDPAAVRVVRRRISRRAARKCPFAPEGEDIMEFQPGRVL